MKSMLTAVELFAGAGGLGMGMSLAGFKSLGVIERDKWAYDTMRENQSRGHPLVADWPVHRADVTTFDYSSIRKPVDVLSGGPPCQAFSMGGKHRAHDDDRDMFPATADVIRKLAPRAFILENVKGLTRSTFSNYLSYILLHLKHPELVKKKNEEWPNHLARLQRHHTSGSKSGLNYRVLLHKVNAADYGIPQRRERVFIVGFQHNLDVRWSFPKETHSLDALLIDQSVRGEYWDRHKVAKRKRPPLSPTMKARMDKIVRRNEPELYLPWRTVRDALIGIPDPRVKSGIFLDHKFQPGARVYKGHTGSPMDLPAKTLKAGVHGVPGGENMMVMDEGGVRYFTVRESARLQTFPDTYKLHGSWSEAMRQLGNAVPVSLAHLVASSVAQKLLELDLNRISRK